MWLLNCSAWSGDNQQALIYRKGKRVTKRKILLLALMIGILSTSIASQNNTGSAIALQITTTTPTAVGVSTIASISAGNLSQLTPLTRLGRGIVSTVAWSPNGKTLAVGSSAGIWLYNTASVNASPHLLGENDSEVEAVAFGSMGILASGHRDGSIRLWDVVSEKELATLQSGEAPILTLVFSPAGDVLLTGSFDGNVILWDVKIHNKLSEIHAALNVIGALAFSSDGKMVAISEFSNVIQLWEIKSGHKVATLQIPSDIVRSLAFSPDGSVLISGDDSGVVRLWDTSKQTLLTSLKSYKTPVTWFSFGADGRTVAFCTGNRVVLWDRVTEAETVVLDQPDSVYEVAINPDSNLLAAAGTNVYLWNVSTHALIATLEGYTPGEGVVEFSPEGGILASGSEDGSIRLWNTKTGTELRSLLGHIGPVYSLAFSSDAALLASGGFDKDIRIWNVATGEQLRILRGQDKPIQSVKFDTNATQLISTDGSTIRIWNVSAGTEPFIIQGGQYLVFAPTTSVMAFAEDRTIHIWSVSQKKELTTLIDPNDPISALAITADGALLASGSGKPFGSNDSTVRIWDIYTGKELFTLSGHTNPIRGMVFSPDSTLLASNGPRDVILWNVKTGIPTHMIKYDSTGTIQSVGFNVDGTIVAFVDESGDGGRFWDIKTDKEILFLKGCRGFRSGLAFSPDGSLLACVRGAVQLWGIPTKN